MDQLFHHTSKDHLKRGDHIYVYRAYGSYSHHGIVVSVDDVNHILSDDELAHLYSPKAKQELGKKTILVVHVRRTGLVITTLEEFAISCRLRKFKYGASALETKVKRAGTCSTVPPLQPDTVVDNVLEELLTNAEYWMEYHAKTRNCEHFATKCKIGREKSSQVEFVNKILAILAKGVTVKLLVPSKHEEQLSVEVK